MPLPSRNFGGAPRPTGRAVLVLALGVLVLVAMRAGPVRQAKADPPVLGPAAWGTVDARLAAPDLVRRALIRYAVLCKTPLPSAVAGGPMVAYANVGLVSGPAATLVSCALGAPAEATCEQLRACTGEQPGEPPPPKPACSGIHAVSAVSLGSPGQEQPFRVAESCLAQGGRCYTGEDTAFCAGDPCTPGETYACDAEGFVLCTEGVRLRSPCPMGTACGPSPGSGILGCTGTGAACSDDGSSCEGTKRIACIRDSFGKGRKAEVDCAAFGLGCIAQGSGAGASAACGITAPAQCDPLSTAWTCASGLVQACVAGQTFAYACADLGMKGACKQGPSGVACVQ